MRQLLQTSSAVLFAALLAAPPVGHAEPPARGKLMVLIDEQGELARSEYGPPSTPVRSNQVALRLVRALMDDGWTVVMPSTSAVVTSPAEAKAVADAAGAELVLFGTVRFTRHPSVSLGKEPPPPLFAVTGVYELTLVSTRAGVLFASESGTMSVTGPKGSLTNAMQKMATSFAQTTAVVADRAVTESLVPLLKQALAKAAPADGGRESSR